MSQSRFDSGRLMGLDVGERWIGVAVTDEFQTVASPVGSVDRGPREIAELRNLAAQYEIRAIVAGLPKGMSGKEGPQASDVREFADAAAQLLGLELRYWDERLTTVQAERALIEAGRRRNQRRDRIDAVAAALMLQNYLDSRSIRRSGQRH